MKYALLLTPLLFGAACTQEASHIPNPLLLPGHAVSNAVQNAGYNARRAKVSGYVHENHAALIRNIEDQGGPYLGQAMALARIPAGEQPPLIARLHSDLKLYRGDPEALTVALMVHGP